MPKLRVLIVGASIAGPTATYWFAKAGASVTVIERFPELRKGGQNIDIRTAGVTVMRRMPGMEEAVRAKIVPIEGLAWVREDGRPYGIIRATGNPDQQSLISEYEIFRGDLAKIIFDLSKQHEDVKYIFGEQVTSIQQSEKNDNPVTVEFANGTPTSEFDLVVACDGATSRTRAIGLGCGVRDYIKSTNCWAAYFSIPGDLLEGSKVGKAISAVGGRFQALGPDPAGVTRVGLMAVAPSSVPDAPAPFRDAMKQGDDALKQFVARHFRGCGWRSDEIIRGLMASNDFYGSELVKLYPPSLSKGRFVLVGDAGYAPGFTGAGTTLALAGAYVLAGEVCKHKNNLTAALEGYEKQMRPLITEMQKQPPFVTSIMAPQTAWGIWLRNHIFAFIAWTRILEVIMKYLAPAFANSKEYKLPEYDWVA